MKLSKPNIMLIGLYNNIYKYLYKLLYKLLYKKGYKKLYKKTLLFPSCQVFLCFQYFYDNIKKTYKKKKNPRRPSKDPSSSYSKILTI